MQLQEMVVRPVDPKQEPEFQQRMESHHDLGALPKIGNTLWYVAVYCSQWAALLCFSAAALKCAPRDGWIGWSFRHQTDRLNLVANNSRFLIVPEWHIPNLASRVLSLCCKRIQNDWLERFGFPLLLLETFVDPQRFHGTLYRAANWQLAGYSKGYRRTGKGYSNTRGSSKMVFVLPLQRNTRTLLSRSLLQPRYRTGAPKMQLTAEQMKSLPEFFKEIPDPRRAAGRRHPIQVVLSIAAAAILCGMRGYKAIADWASALSPIARARFRCRYRDGRYQVPSMNVVRDVLMRVDPVALDQAIQSWNEHYGASDESLAIDGKTMCNALHDDDRQTHIMSVIGHQSKHCYTQKKSLPCR